MTNLLGEFLGTAVLIIFGAGVVANVLLKDSKGQGSGWIVITTGWALAVFAGVFTAVALGAPQADLNCAVTLAKYLRGGIYTLDQAIMTMVVQTVGAIAGSVVVWLAYLPHWEITEDPGLKLGVFATGPAVRDLKANLLTEIIATFMLMFSFFALFSPAVGAIPPGVGPYLAGMVIFALGLSLGGPTGYAMNPARDLGPRIAHAILPIAGKGSSDWGYAWVPVVGPFVGAALAYVFAKAIGLI